MPQASPLPYRTHTHLAKFATLPLALAWRRLLMAQCPRLRFTTIESQDDRYRKIWQLEATDADQAEPAEAEQWQRAFQLLADPAVGLLVSQLVTAEQRKAELEQMAIEIQADCLCALADHEDSGQTLRILRLLSQAGFSAPRCQILSADALNNG